MLTNPVSTLLKTVPFIILLTLNPTFADAEPGHLTAKPPEQMIKDRSAHAANPSEQDRSFHASQNKRSKPLSAPLQVQSDQPGGGHMIYFGKNLSAGMRLKMDTKHQKVSATCEVETATHAH